MIVMSHQVQVLQKVQSHLMRMRMIGGKHPANLARGGPAKKSSRDNTLEILTKKIEELTTQRIREPGQGEKWCVNFKMINHSTKEYRQCDVCVV